MLEYVQIGFSEEWYNDRFDADFSEDFWIDPVRRTESYREFDYQVEKIYPDLGLGSLEPKPNPSAADQYGHRFIPKLFGCEMVYLSNQAPACLPQQKDYDALAALDMPDLNKSDVIKKALEDAKILKSKYGFVNSAINKGSPLNAAVSTFGEDFLACCLCEPEAARHVLMIFAKTMIRLNYEFEDVINPPSRINRDDSGLGNCPAIMFSPEVYREVILPVDLWLRQQFKGFGIHHCGVFDNYAELYTELRPTSLDIGGGTDYKLLRRFFPNIPCSYSVNAELFEGKDSEEIDRLVQTIVTDGGPKEHITFLHAQSIGSNATDENIVSLRTSIKRQFRC